MSTIIKQVIQAEDLTSMEEILDRISEALIYYSNRHNDFSYKISPDFEKNEIEVVSLHLHEEMN
jgi:thymidylate kinase